jgi:hypothetical protein
MPKLSSDEQRSHIRHYIEINKDRLYDILKTHYSKNAVTIKQFEQILEKANISAWWSASDTIEIKIGDFIQKCGVEFDITQIYNVFRYLAEDFGIAFIKISFGYIQNIIEEDEPETDWDKFLKIGRATKSSNFSKIKAIKEALDLLNKRVNHSDACSNPPPCELHDYITKTGKGVRRFDKEFYNVLFLIEKLGAIYKRIDQLFTFQNIVSGLPKLGTEIRKLYDDTKKYILVDPSLNAENVTQGIKNILNNTTVLPEINNAVNGVLDGLNLIREKCVLKNIPQNNQDLIFDEIQTVYDKIPDIVAEISKNLQEDLEFSVLALNEEIAPIESKRGEPPFRIKERLIPKETLRLIKVHSD